MRVIREQRKERFAPYYNPVSMAEIGYNEAAEQEQCLTKVELYRKLST